MLTWRPPCPMCLTVCLRSACNVVNTGATARARNTIVITASTLQVFAAASAPGVV